MLIGRKLVDASGHPKNHYEHTLSHSRKPVPMSTNCEKLGRGGRGGLSLKH